MTNWYELYHLYTYITYEYQYYCQNQNIEYFLIVQPFPTQTKRRRLMKNGSFVHNNVVNLASSDEENTIANKQFSDATSPKYGKMVF